jgi:hypothetical protein
LRLNLKVDLLSKAFNRREKIKRNFERFNLNRCFYYTIHQSKVIHQSKGTQTNFQRITAKDILEKYTRKTLSKYHTTNGVGGGVRARKYPPCRIRLTCCH